jgi:hypothetical protein
MSAATTSAAFEKASLRDAQGSGVLDAHEYITCHLRFGDPLKAIVVYDAASVPYDDRRSGRILFTRKRSDLGCCQICSFGFKRTVVNHAGGKTTYEFALVRDLLSGITKISKDAAAVLKRISKILGTGAIEFASRDHAEAMSLRAPEHIKYLREMKKATGAAQAVLQDEFVQLHSFALPASWAEPETKKPRTFDPESQRVMAVLLNVDADGKETEVKASQRISSVDVFDTVRYALEARSFGDALQEAVQQRLSPETRDVEKWIKAKKAEGIPDPKANDWLKQFGIARKTLKAGVRAQLSKELTNAPADMIKRALSGAASETKKHLCVGWTDDMSYGAAMDCFHLAILQQPRHRPLNAVHESYVIRSDLMVDFLAGWCLLSAVDPAKPDMFLNGTKTLLDYLKHVLPEQPITLHKFFLDRAANLAVEHLAPMVASIEGWCRGLREQDIFGLLIRQTSDHRCVMVPTGNPEVFYMYWRSKLHDRTCVVREVVEIKKPEGGQSLAFQVAGNRSQRVVLGQDSVERAYAKLSQRITVGGFDPADGEAAGETELDATEPGGLNLRVLAPLSISDMFSFHTRKWTKEDEKEMVGNDTRMASPSAKEISATQFSGLFTTDELNGGLGVNKIQVMQPAELQQALKGYRQSQSEDFQTYLRSMGADF